MRNLIIVISLVIFHGVQAQIAVGTEFTYQGELLLNNQQVTGMYDLKFVLYDAELDTQGSIVGQSVSINVDVVQSIFTTQIDFGINAFAGDKAWMEISIRDGGTAGGYQQMLPRVAITSAPYAIHAQFVGADAVTGTEILNGTIMNVDMGANSVNANNIVNNTIGTSEINSTQVQRRISATCTTGSVITAINEDGSLVCAYMGPEQTPFNGSAIMTPAQQQTINRMVGDSSQLWTRCYQLSVDTQNSTEFHTKCDNRGPSVTFYSTPDSANGIAKIFGGYNGNAWSANYTYKGYDDAFLFALDSGTGEIEKFPVGYTYTHTSYNHTGYGPTFGNGHDIYINAAMDLSYVNFPYAFSCDGKSQGSFLGGPNQLCTQRLSGLNVTSTVNVSLIELEVWIMENKY